MAIQYTTSGVIIRDDRNPDRPPLVLPTSATSTEIEHSIVEYLGAEALRPEPNYQGFYQALLTSSVYQAVLAQPATAELARALAVFVSAIQDCMASRENRQAMQGAIWMLLSQVALSQENAAELQELMRLYSLEGVYVLQPS